MLSAILLTGALLVASLASCSSAPRKAAVPGPRTLPPDSAALLAAALRQARPAYATQEEALRAEVYAHAAPARPAAPTPVAATPRMPVPAGAMGDGRGVLYVIQIGAYRDLGIAEAAASDAEQRFPELSVVIQAAGEYFRIALAGWPEPGTARAALRVVRPYYPDAWLRRVVP